MHEGILVPLATFTFVVLIVWIRSVNTRMVKERRADLIRQLIDKFSTGEALASAMESSEESRLLEFLALETKSDKSNGDKLSTLGLYLGMVPFCLGIGFFILRFSSASYFLIPAVILTSIGVGILASTLLARRYFQKEQEQTEQEWNGNHQETS